MTIDLEKEKTAAELKGSLLYFARFFYEHMTRREFIVSQPTCRESHQITICRELTKLTRLESEFNRLAIHVPPGHGKSLLVSSWIAWCFTQYPDSNFLYLSYSHELASKHTEFIKRLMSTQLYQYLFDVHLRQDSRAKDHFMTTAGGAVAAFGSGGAITGRDAGLPGLDRFSGAVVIDDPIKPDAGHSDTIRATVIKNYEETIRQRVRGVNVPIVFIGQRIHEDDLGAYIENDRDIQPWHLVKLQALDGARNALYPEVNPKEQLEALEAKSPYVFASQFQQDPLPAGGALFKPEYFLFLDDEPKMLLTFITGDTSETSKSYNDATVFSFFGLYEIEAFGRKTGELGLHWIDCLETRIEPKDIRDTFMDFWADCMCHPVPPLVAAIEKKSTGVTLVSVLSEVQGLQIRNIERNRSSGSKADRFLAIQPFLAAKLVTFTTGARHAQMCITHMKKITANDTHRFDDIADTLADAVKIALIDKTLQPPGIKAKKSAKITQTLGNALSRKLQAGARRNAAISSQIHR